MLFAELLCPICGGRLSRKENVHSEMVYSCDNPNCETVLFQDYDEDAGAYSDKAYICSTRKVHSNVWQACQRRKFTLEQWMGIMRGFNNVESGATELRVKKEEKAKEPSAKQTGYKELANKLVTASSSYAIQSYSAIYDQFPTTKRVDTENWDFFLAIAGIFAAVSHLKHLSIPKEEMSEILAIVFRSLSARYPNGVQALEDCRTLVEINCNTVKDLPSYKAEPEYIFSDSVGIWIVLNVFGASEDTSKFSDQERRLARILGGLMTIPFQTWWGPKHNSVH